MTNETVTFIEYHMAYARGLQYRTVWLIQQGYECRSPNAGTKIDEPL